MSKVINKNNIWNIHWKSKYQCASSLRISHNSCRFAAFKKGSILPACLIHQSSCFREDWITNSLISDKLNAKYIKLYQHYSNFIYCRSINVIQHLKLKQYAIVAKIQNGHLFVDNSDKNFVEELTVTFSFIIMIPNLHGIYDYMYFLKNCSYFIILKNVYFFLKSGGFSRSLAEAGLLGVQTIAGTAWHLLWNRDCPAESGTVGHLRHSPSRNHFNKSPFPR